MHYIIYSRKTELNNRSVSVHVFLLSFKTHPLRNYYVPDTVFAIGGLLSRDVFWFFYLTSVFLKVFENILMKIAVDIFLQVRLLRHV